MTTTRDERRRAHVGRLPLRLARKVLPYHTLMELYTETRLAWLRLTRRGVDRRYSSATDLYERTLYAMQ